MNIDLKNKKAFIFDMDDTLLRTIDFAFDVHIQLAKKYYDLDISKEEIMAVWGQPFPIMNENLYKGKIDTKVFEKQIYEVEKDFDVLHHDKVDKILLKLKESEKHTGIITSSTRLLTDLVLEKAGLDKSNFKFIQTVEDTDFHKPDPRVFDAVKNFLNNLGISNAELIYFGDNVSDYLAARDAGIDFIGLETGIKKKQDFLDLGLSESNIMPQIGDILESI